LQLNSTSIVVSNYHESWYGVDAGGPTYQHLDCFLPLFLSPLPSIQAYRESWHGVKLPSCCICPVPSFYGRFNFLSIISIMPSLFHEPTAIEAPIISVGNKGKWLLFKANCLYVRQVAVTYRCGTSVVRNLKFLTPFFNS
jgi:hypothetical protein